MTSYQAAALTTSAAVSKLLFYSEDYGDAGSKQEYQEHPTGGMGGEDDSMDSSYILDRTRLACISTSADCSSWTVVYFIICAYILSALIANLIACYKFIATWNLIVTERRLDLKGVVQRRRRLTLKEALRTHVTMDTMTCSSCCICLSDFKEDELVTACDDGCGKWFHRECLFNWLDHSNDCPCCRKDMLTKKSKGLLGDLMEFVGFSDS